jgi:hypothetical protein
MKPLKRISLAFSSMTLALLAGCVNPMSTGTTSTSNSPPSTASNGATSSSLPTSLPFGYGAAPNPAALARRVEVAWSSDVMTTSDTENGNRPLTGLAGRLYVFSEEVGRPLEVPGAVTVVVYSIDKENKRSKPLVTWNIDSTTLRRLGRKDAIGFGYTLFLPWVEYTPDIRRVQLDVRYVPDGGQPLFAPASTLALHQDGPPATFTNQLVPVTARK